MLRRRTTIHENRVQQCRTICGGQSVIQAFVSSDCSQVGFILRTKIPRSRLTRTGLRYHHWSYPETGRTRSSVCTRPAVQQSPRNWRRHANYGGTRLWIGRTSGHGRGLPVDRSEKRKSAKTFAVRLSKAAKAMEFRQLNGDKALAR